MANVTLRNCKITEYKGVPKEGVRVFRTKFEADYTEKVREELSELKWEPLPETSEDMDLIGTLLEVEFTMQAGGGLKDSIKVKAVSAQKFSAVRVNIPKKKTTNEVIRFEIISTNDTCAELVDGYMQTAGGVSGVLTIKYASSKRDQEKPNDTRQGTLLVEEPKTRKTKGEVN